MKKFVITPLLPFLLFICACSDANPEQVGPMATVISDRQQTTESGPELAVKATSQPEVTAEVVADDTKAVCEQSTASVKYQTHSPEGAAVKQAGIHQAWRLTNAAERIERLRKGTSTVQFVDPDGLISLSGCPVDFELKRHEFLFGVSMGQSWSIYDKPNFERYREHLGDVFNYIALGLHRGWMEKREGQRIPIEHAESNLEWARSMGMTVKGMPLLWHNAIPRWFAIKDDPEEIERLIYDHIRYLLTNYPEIEHWGAQNETIAALKDHTQKNAVTRWVQHKGGAGPAAAWVLNEARDIAPDKVYVNNHYTHLDPEFKAHNQYLISNNVEFGAIGIQTHLHNQQRILTEDQLWDFLEDYAQFGKPIHLTEITVLSSEPFENWDAQEAYLTSYKKRRAESKRDGTPLQGRVSTPELEQYQASYLRDFYILAFSHPSVESIVYWSGSDLDEWRGSAGGLLDTEHNPKPAYHMLESLIKETWHTKAVATIDSSGRIEFDGFYGDYEGFVNIGGERHSFIFTHSSGNNDVRVVNLK